VPASSEQSKKHLQPHKKKPKTASDEETEYISDSDSASDTSDSDIEVIVGNEEVQIVIANRLNGLDTNLLYLIAG